MHAETAKLSKKTSKIPTKNCVKNFLGGWSRVTLEKKLKGIGSSSLLSSLMFCKGFQLWLVPIMYVVPFDWLRKLGLGSRTAPGPPGGRSLVLSNRLNRKIGHAIDFIIYARITIFLVGETPGYWLCRIYIAVLFYLLITTNLKVICLKTLIKDCKIIKSKLVFRFRICNTGFPVAEGFWSRYKEPAAY